MDIEIISNYPIFSRKIDGTYDFYLGKIILPKIYIEDIDLNYMENITFDKLKKDILSPVEIENISSKDCNDDHGDKDSFNEDQLKETPCYELFCLQNDQFHQNILEILDKYKSIDSSSFKISTSNNECNDVITESKNLSSSRKSTKKDSNQCTNKWDQKFMEKMDTDILFRLREYDYINKNTGHNMNFEKNDLKYIIDKIIESTKDEDDFLYEILNDKEINEIVSFLRSNGKLKNIIDDLNSIIDPRYNIKVIREKIILTKYSYDVKNITNDNKKFVNEIIHWGEKYVVFVMKIWAWINHCIDNNIPSAFHHKHLQKFMMVQNFTEYFKTDDESYVHWRKYGYDPPIVFINRKFKNNLSINEFKINDVDAIFIEFKKN